MLENWLSAPSKDKIIESGFISDIVADYSSNLSKSSSNIFLVSDGSEFAQQSKEAFYRLRNHFSSIEIYDLGHLKNENPEFIIGLFRELVPMKGRIVVLSDKNSYLDSAFRALEYSNKHISLALINSRIDVLSEDRSARSLTSENLLNLSTVGYQRHFCPPDLLTYMHESFVHHLSFGQATADLLKVEPILRHTHAAVLELGALRSALMPNGFDGLQICQLAKYAGMSSSMQILNVANTIGLPVANSALIVGQILWYFVEGHSLREQSPKTKDLSYFQEHLVQTDYSNYSFTFWKSSKTNRWWFEIPSEGEERGNIYPCNHEDYELACRNEISEYLLNQMNLDH